MGIEKISNNSTASYQGSATVSAATPAVTNVEAVADTAPVISDVVTTQGSNFNTDTGKEKGHSEELGMNNKQLTNAVAELNKQLTNSEAIFGIHEETNRVTIKIVDKSTKEVIKEYPPEQTLDMIAKVWEIAGILVDEKR